MKRRLMLCGMLEKGAEAGDDPDDLPAEGVPPYATAGGVLEGLMASCLGVCVSVSQVCCSEAGGRSSGFHWPRLHGVL